jgi:hypothetical protein
VTEDEWQKVGNAAHPAFVASCSRGPRALVLPTQRCLPLVYQEQPDWAVHEDTRRYSTHVATRNSGTQRTQTYATSLVRPSS